MTDVTHKVLARQTYVFGAACVWLCACTFGIANAAQAGVWQEFEARCLAPMENIEATVVDGLAFSKLADGVEIWVPNAGDWDLRRAPPEAADAAFCEVFGNYKHASVEAWIKRVSASQTYEELPREKPEYARIFSSTQWREPKLQVWIGALMGKGQLVVVETDLES